MKKLETKGYINRSRSKEDERNLNICIAEKGIALRDKALEVPIEISKCVNLAPEEVIAMHKGLYKILDYFKSEE